MPHAAKIIADSVSPAGHRLTTFEIVIPRIILSEFNTHRMLARNSSSSRAIPVEKMLKMVLEDPYIPTHWGKNQKGMQADEELDLTQQRHAELEWLLARDHAVTRTKGLLDIGVHKQITNRLLEPFMWHTVVVTATEWDNFWHLRAHKDAHPEIQKIAVMMRSLYEDSKPRELELKEWHLPYITEADRAEVFIEGAMSKEEGTELLKKASVGRCAAVSYLRQSLAEMQKDTERCDRMLAGGHMSPFEHVARPMTEPELETFQMHHLTVDDESVIPTRYESVSHVTEILDLRDNKVKRVRSSRSTYFNGPFNGWTQYRKEIPNEHDLLAPTPAPETAR